MYHTVSDSMNHTVSMNTNHTTKSTVTAIRMVGSSLTIFNTMIILVAVVLDPKPPFKK